MRHFFLLVLNEPIICLYDLLFEQDVILEKSTLLTDWFFSQNTILSGESVSVLVSLLSYKDLVHFFEHFRNVISKTGQITA